MDIKELKQRHSSRKERQLAIQRYVERVIEERNVFRLSVVTIAVRKSIMMMGNPIEKEIEEEK